MNLIVKSCFIALVGVLVGCATSAEFTKTGDVSVASRNKGCDFNIYTTPPKGDYDELGIIEFETAFCTTCPDKASKVKAIVQTDVCIAGGNGILLWEANGRGMYLKTTVIRVRE